MRKFVRHLAGTSLAALALASLSVPALAAKYEHVLLISVDGMHAVDLANYVTAHPSSALASLAQHGIAYPNALTTAPSDSFPGLTAQVTGSTPKSAGVFYDVSYDRTLFAPGSHCQGSPGTVPTFDETLDHDLTSYTGGGTLGNVMSQIDRTHLPLALVNGTCVWVYPHSFIEVNTIFEVIRAHGGRTAWADKHPAYDLVNGPSGAGVQDLFTPEVDSNDTTAGLDVRPSDPSWFNLGNTVTGQDTTLGFHSIQRNDLRKVHAVLNEIAGYASTDDAHHTWPLGMPTILGMNFQAVSVGQKLAIGNGADPLDAGLVGGYADAVGQSPRSGLQLALDFVDGQLHAMLAQLQKHGHAFDTLVIVSAKHGQSPINLADRQAFDDAPYGATPGIDAYITDDVSLVWLKPGLQTLDYNAARAYLESQAGTLGIVQLLDRTDLAPLYGDPFSNKRTPDFIGITEHGLIYTSGTKLAEHGGFANDDRNVALLVSNPGIAGTTNTTTVETRQIAPTILSVLGISPTELQGVQKEQTKILPGKY